MKIEPEIVNRVILDNENQEIKVTGHQLAQFGRNIVLATLKEMGLKSDQMMSGRVYRTEIITSIGRDEYERAVKEGHLTPCKKNPLKRNSKVFVRRNEWDRYVKLKINRL